MQENEQFHTLNVGEQKSLIVVQFHNVHQIQVCLYFGPAVSLAVSLPQTTHFCLKILLQWYYSSIIFIVACMTHANYLNT